MIKILKKMSCCLFVSAGFLTTLNAVEIKKEEKKEIVEKLVESSMEGNAYNVNLLESILYGIMSKNDSITSATTRHGFLKEINQILDTIPVSHFNLLDGRWYEDIETLEEMGLMDHLCGTQILPSRVEGKITSKKFKVTKVLPGIMPCPIKKDNEILQISELKTLKEGLDLWLKSPRKDQTFEVIQYLKNKKLNFKQIENKEDLKVPSGKMRIAIYTNGQSIFITPLYPTLYSEPAQEFTLLDENTPIVRIRSFSSGDEVSVKMLGQKDSKDSSFVQSYDRKKMEEILRKIHDKSQVILDLRDNDGGEFAESNILAWSCFGAPMAVVKVAPGVNTRYDYNDLQQEIHKVYAKHQKLGQSFEDAFRDFESKSFPITSGKTYYCPEGIPWKNYYPKFNEDGKVVILMNRRTASAAEFFIHQMKVHLQDRCILIGEKTAGAGTESKIIHLPHGFVVSMPQTERVPITGSQERIEQVGLSTDIAIENSDIMKDSEDPCILAATKILEE